MVCSAIHMFGTGQADTGTWWKQGNPPPSPGAELVGWQKLPWPAIITLQTGFYQEQRQDLGQVSAQGSKGKGGSETCKEAESPCAQDEHPATAFGETHPMQTLVTEW